MARKLSTVNEIIDALGGTAATARLTRRKLQAVSNWRAENKLPASVFLLMDSELKRRGFEAPPKAWGMEAAHE